MTLLITLFAAIASTVVWYFVPQRKRLFLAVPCFAFWGASIMWLVDAIFELAELKEAYFAELTGEGMANDIALGFSAVALGLLIWVIVLLIKDPDGVLFKKKK